MKPLTTQDHDRWNALIALCLRDRPPKPLAIQRAARRCQAVRGDRNRGASMPEGHCHADSCFARLIADGLAYRGEEGAFWALQRFAEACWAVMAELPPPVPPRLRKPIRRGRKSAFRYRPRAMSAPKPRWLSRADLNN